MNIFRGSFGGYPVDQITVEITPTEYASRAALEAATGLAVGYYSVPSNTPEILTYWNGAAFVPELALWDAGGPTFLEDSLVEFGAGWTAEDTAAPTELP